MRVHKMTMWNVGRPFDIFRDYRVTVSQICTLLQEFSKLLVQLSYIYYISRSFLVWKKKGSIAGRRIRNRSWNNVIDKTIGAVSTASWREYDLPLSDHSNKTHSENAKLGRRQLSVQKRTSILAISSREGGESNNNFAKKQTQYHPTS